MAGEKLDAVINLPNLFVVDIMGNSKDEVGRDKEAGSFSIARNNSAFGKDNTDIAMQFLLHFWGFLDLVEDISTEHLFAEVCLLCAFLRFVSASSSHYSWPLLMYIKYYQKE